MKWFQTYVSPDFRCVLKTDLSVEEVQRCLRENVSKDFQWPWKPQPLLGGEVKGERFRVWDRGQDSGLDLDCVIEPCGTGARILVSAGYGFLNVLGAIPLGFGIGFFLWHTFGEDYPVYSAAGCVAIACIVVLMHFDGISRHWSELESTLETLVSLLRAEVVERSHR